jgi:hypothetical protein
MATIKKSTPPRPAGDKVKISPNVKVILKQVGKLDANAKQVLMQNIRAANKVSAAEAKANAAALKAANKTPKNKDTGATRGSLYSSRSAYTGSSSGRVGINYNK